MNFSIDKNKTKFLLKSMINKHSYVNNDASRENGKWGMNVWICYYGKIVGEKFEYKDTK